MKKNGKIYFASDVHLRAPALNNNREREIIFASWLDEIKDDAAELYLVGDIFDFWYEYKKVVPRGFTRILGRLADMADNGTEIHFFVGNHDLWAFGYFEEELGIKIHQKELIKEINGKRFFICHGDRLDATDKSYLLMRKVFSNRTIQWIFSRLHPNFAFTIAHKWSKSRRLSKINIDDKFDSNNEGMYNFALSYLKKDKIDFFVFGHRHVMLDTGIGESSRFILLGDWIKNFSYGVFDGKNFKLKNYKKY